MRVLTIECDDFAKVVQVRVAGDRQQPYVRNFPADSFQPADVERFLSDCAELAQRLRDIRGIFIPNGSVIPFPSSDGPEAVN